MDKVVEFCKPLLKLSILLAYCELIHALNLASQIIGGMFLAATVAVRGYKNQSLSPSGSIAAVVVGWITLASSFRAGLVLLGFFFASSALTKLGETNKDVEEEFKKGGQRDWVQVLSNGGFPALYALLASFASGGLDYAVMPYGNTPIYSALSAAFLGYFACCCGDTWSSEIGQLSDEEPRLITTLRPVRKGTNGGVTLLGLAASVSGGFYIGLLFYICGLISPSGVRGGFVQQWQVVLVGTLCGLIGSLIDSVFGATIQFTGYNRKTGKITGRNGPDVSRISGVAILDNNGVNVVSAVTTSLLSSLLLFALS